MPTEAEFELVAKGLRMGRARGLSGMRAEDLKVWRKEAKQEKDPVGIRWQLVVRLL